MNAPVGFVTNGNAIAILCIVSLVIQMKRKINSVGSDGHTKGVAAIPYSHRLHYYWSQIEASRLRHNAVGSPRRPRTRADRTLKLDGKRSHCTWSTASSLRKNARFNMCAKTYETINYNTCQKNGVLKLTEIEMYFLSTRMTRSSSSEWAVVYLGIGNGDRFRWLRDEFFPGLSVIAFDPLDDFFEGVRDDVEANARLWSNDGTHFLFLVRCFDEDKDITWVKERLAGKRLLLISDIRGMNFHDDGATFDKARDQDIQWKAIQRLHPERSLVKFTVPDPLADSYDYVPGVLLKQIFCYFGTTELRLMIDGVPEHTKRYDVWELLGKVTYHHEYLRGQVYKTTRRPDRIPCACLDCCFDCTVLWDTVSSYASQSNIDPYKVLRSIIENHIYSPEAGGTWKSDLEYFLSKGRLMEAVAVLEAEDVDNRGDVDWLELADSISHQQPKLAQRIRFELSRPSPRGDLVRILGSLAEPFTLVRSELNTLLEYAPNTWSKRFWQVTEYDLSLYKTAPCWYYERGSCVQGDDCVFRHGDDDVGCAGSHSLA